MVMGKHGVRQLPSRAGSVVGGLFVTGFGIFWIMMAGSATRMSSNSHGVGSMFPLFGILFVAFGIVLSI